MSRSVRSLVKAVRTRKRFIALVKNYRSIALRALPTYLRWCPSKRTPPGFGSTFEMRGPTAAAPKKRLSTHQHEKLNVLSFQQNRALHRWRQPLRNCQDARLRHRLQAPLEGIPEPRDSAARVLLHRDHRRSGIFVDPPFDRLARLQRLHRGHQGDQGI